MNSAVAVIAITLALGACVMLAIGPRGVVEVW